MLTFILVNKGMSNGLLHPATIDISQKLDRLINEFNYRKIFIKNETKIFEDVK
ncbi:aspartyl-phosphate phosphatase Spo0E family protein [Desulfuribacillus stibiiarsenatis]|uniref:aspartyl-phosphate phosphatase Spo0E family protein n=1 Tax=Desulfuribacillus stibiiarsenatis TaxID=1390249 RepID=UPI00345C3517